MALLPKNSGVRARPGCFDTISCQWETDEDVLTQCTMTENFILPDDDLFFITWNPKDYYFRNLGFQEKWHRMIKVLYCLRRASKSFCIMPEISDTGRLHCHGWYTLKDKVKLFKSVIPSLELRGFVKITKQKHKGKGMDYYRQDIKDTRPLIPDKSYPLTKDNCKRIHNYAKRFDDRVIIEQYVRSRDLTSWIDLKIIDPFIECPEEDPIEREDLEEEEDLTDVIVLKC